MDLISGWCRSQRKLLGVTAVVTGSNSGIGKETARDLFNRGARVIMACRDITRAEAAKREIEESGKDSIGTLVVKEIDLTRMKSVKKFAKDILEEEESVDILICNGGVMTCPEGRTEDGYETHIGTNHFGHALLTLILLPRMRKSPAARVVFVSSMLHQKENGLWYIDKSTVLGTKIGEQDKTYCYATPIWLRGRIAYRLDIDDINFEKRRYVPIEAYSQSKAANVLFAKALTEKFKEHNISNITTYSLHPGVIATEIGRHFSDTFLSGATWLFKNVLSWFVKSPRCGAQTTIYCAIDEKCASESGLYYSDCSPTTPSKACRNPETISKLWNKTMETLQVHLGTFDPFGDKDPVLY